MCVVAFVAWLLCLTAYSSDNPPLTISVESGNTEWEVGARTSHTLKITNRSSTTLTIPSFRFLNTKGEDAEIALYVKEQILQMHVVRGSVPVQINKDWQTVPEKPRSFETVEIRPDETISVSFSLTRQWHPSFFSLTKPGEYVVTMTLDTTQVKSDNVLKGRFVSTPAVFRIIPVTIFRSKETHESHLDYAKAKVVFYLDRIENRKGEYFPNVKNILDTQDAVPALIEILDSKDDANARRAQTILEQIHHPLGNKEPPDLPNSKNGWAAWWRINGDSMPPRKLWANFDSHYQ